MTIRPPSKQSWKNTVSTIRWRSPQMKSACNTAASPLFPLRSCSTRKAASFIKNAVRATELPGVDLSKLTPEQKIVALHKFNAEGCNCGCQYTLAQCRIYDRNCQSSSAATEKIIAALAHSAPAKSEPGAPPPPPALSASPPTSEKPLE